MTDLRFLTGDERRQVAALCRKIQTLERECCRIAEQAVRRPRGPTWVIQEVAPSCLGQAGQCRRQETKSRS
jgi:hypothetical protein